MQSQKQFVLIVEFDDVEFDVLLVLTLISRLCFSSLCVMSGSMNGSVVLSMKVLKFFVLRKKDKL